LLNNITFKNQHQPQHPHGLSSTITIHPTDYTHEKMWPLPTEYVAITTKVHVTNDLLEHLQWMTPCRKP